MDHPAQKSLLTYERIDRFMGFAAIYDTFRPAVPCLRWQVRRYLAFEDVSHRGVVAGQT
jgi:hypothetical protein